MRSLGVLGIGPQATIDLEIRIHRAAQARIPPRGNSGYPPMVIYHHRRPPVAMGTDGTPDLPLRPDPELLAAARWLGGRVDFVVIAANSPHRFASEIQTAAGCDLLSMIDVTVDEIRRRAWNSVGVLGFFDSDAPYYTDPLRRLGLRCETIDPARQGELDEAILRVMEGRETSRSREAARAAVSNLLARDVDGVVLGCTEIPLLLQLEVSTDTLLNPTELLADAAVELALSDEAAPGDRPG